jgi:hypothetical protein
MLFTTTSLTPVVTGLERGTHRFRLQAQNHRGNLTGPTDPTAEVTITGPELPPQPPVRDGVISVGERSVRTQWNASLRATGYTLGVSLSDANPPNLFNFVDTTELQGEVTGLDLNTTYYVFLKSSNTVGKFGLGPGRRCRDVCNQAWVGVGCGGHHLGGFHDRSQG